MALGVDCLQSGEKKPELDSLVATLRRCLDKAAIPYRPTVVLEDKIECFAPVDAGCLQPDGTQWPHCQHNISHDDPKCIESKQFTFQEYRNENDINDVVRLMTKDLSEPYSLYTYRFFTHNWPDLCILAYDEMTAMCVGAIVGRLEDRVNHRRGYIAMLAVDEGSRRMGLATRLVRCAIQKMQAQGCDEVYLETEVTNQTAQGLYGKLGFIRDKRLMRYYLNGNDAYRLKLFMAPGAPTAVY